MSSTLDPALFRLELALSEFSKAGWTADRPVDVHLQPAEPDLVPSVPPPPRGGRRISFARAGRLIAFCSGVAATLAWQSYGGVARKMTAPPSSQLAPSQPASASDRRTEGSSREARSFPAPQAASEAAARAIEAGGFVVQLSAARSEPEAQAAFRMMQARYAVLSGRPLLIRRKDQGGRGTFYAAQVGPFGVKTDADQLCETLKSAGGACFVQKI